MKHYLFISIVVVLFSSCHNHKHDHDSHEEHTYHTNLQLSGYNEEYEIFVEANSFAVKENSKLAVHLTRLSDFKPVEAGVVTISLIVKDKVVNETLEAPSVKGIYHFQLKPETAGEGKLVFDIQTPTGKKQIQIDGVTVYEDGHTAEEEAVVHPNAIAFLKEQSWKIDFSTQIPIIEPFGQVIKTTAQVQYSLADETIVAARTSGIVLFSENIIVEGKDVVVGKELFSVSGAGMVENNVSVRFTEAQNNYMKAEADYKRAQELTKEKIVSDKEFMQIKSEYETTKAVYDNLYKNFTSTGQRVSSPIGGYVKQLFVINGQYVDAGQPLVSVSRNKSLMLKADVPAKYASVLPFVISASIRSMDKQTTYSLEELNGKILSFGKSVNDNNFMIPVTFQIDNKSGFIPGGFVEVFIKTRSEQSAMTLPNDALTEEQGDYFVYVQLTPESFEKREVNIGTTDGLRTEILSGLDKNDRVVTKGAISVKLAQSSGTLDPHAGHVH